MGKVVAWKKRTQSAFGITKVLVEPQRWFAGGAQKCERLLMQARHQELQAICQRLYQASPPRQKQLDKTAQKALFYLAKSHYYLGDWEQTTATLEQLFHYAPWLADARYLATDTARLSGHKETAWQHLAQLYPHSKRLKTWLYMAELVQSPQEWIDMQGYVRHAQQMHCAPAYHPSLSDYLSKGAQRGGDFEQAKHYWRDTLARASAKRIPKSILRARRVDFSVLNASQALEDVKKALDSADIPMFLVSGTLLGCIREGGLLGHDHDIDIGIWDNVSPERLMEVTSQAGIFRLLPQRHKGCLRIKHLNGVAIDIFTHYREPTSYWHGGVKVRWHNTPFELTSRKFLGQHYLVPKDYENYLTENYGDWRVTQHTFDSTLDTPNAEILCERELTIHAYQQCYRALRAGREAQLTRYRELLQQLNEPDPLPTFRHTNM